MSSCSSSSNTIPTSKQLYADLTPENTYVWVGKEEAFIQENQQWKRKPDNDYDFSVIGRRFSNHWPSVKNQVRHHPEYDGLVSARGQTHIFKINYRDKENLKLNFDLISTFGDGTGVIDKKIQHGEMIFKANDISYFAPYTHFKIT